MSSYQLELTLSITFDIAVLMNITPDHIDRHGGFDGYVKAKRQIFHRQTKPRTAIVGVDDPTSGGIYEARSEEHTSELHSLMRISYAVFCLQKKKSHINI